MALKLLLIACSIALGVHHTHALVIGTQTKNTTILALTQESNRTFLGPTTNSILNDVEVTCFRQTTGVKLKRLKYNDCDRLSQQVVSEDPEKPQEWGIDQPGFKGSLVPVHWPPIGTCKAQMDEWPPQSSARDEFTNTDIGNIMAQIIQDCLTNQLTAYGGSALVGPKERFRVTITGSKRPYSGNDVNDDSAESDDLTEDDIQNLLTENAPNMEQVATY